MTIPATLMALVTVGAPAAAAAAPVAERAGQAPASGAIVLKGNAPVSDATLRVRLPRPAEIDLANGLHLMVLEDHRLPQVHFTLVVQGAGGYFDSADRVGLATLTAAMLREGTAALDSEQLSRRLDILGASLEASAGPASPDAIVSGSCLSEHIAVVIELLADMVVHPAFRQDELEGVKRRMQAALLQDRTSPFFLAKETLSKAIYGDDPAGRVAPVLDVLNGATLAELQALHRARYAADRAMLALAGDVSVTTMRPLLERAFGSWRRAHVPGATTGPVRWPAAPTVRVIERPHSVQTNLVVGAPAVSRTHADFDALLVMNQIVGAGPTGRLFVTLREEKGYTYGAFSSLFADRTWGQWSANTDVGSAVTKPALHDLLLEIARVREQPVPEWELQRQKRAMIAGFALTLESPTQMLGYHVTRWLQRLPIDYWDALPERIMAVTSAQVKGIAARYLDASRLQIVAVGERETIMDALAGMSGGYEVYDASGRKASAR
jgi:zinc protease